MYNYIYLFCLGTLSLLSHAVYANDFKLTIKEALEKSANQQVLSQEVAKVYVALCNNIREPKFYQERDAAIEAFDEELHQLSLFTPTPKIKENIQNVRTLWKAYKAIAGWSIKKDAAAKLLKQSTNLLQATKLLHAAYSDYEKSQQTANPNGDLITIEQYLKQNNNQLILNQRVILYYLAEKQGIDATNSGHKLEDAQNSFAGILKILDDARITSDAIKAKLQIIKNAWAGINQHLIFVNKDQSYVEDMLNRSKIIDKTIREISTIYKDLGVKLSISYAMNQATAQSMLTQKIAKAYIASTNDHISYKYKKEVLERIDDFETKIKAMQVTAPSDNVKSSIRVVQTMWKNYKALVSNFTEMDEIRIIKALEQCHVVMAACDRVAEEVDVYAQSIPAYKALSEKDGEKVNPSEDITHQIKVAGRMRIYSQRVALYFMMKTLNLDKDVSTKRLNSCIQEFGALYNSLKESRLNSAAMNKLLESCMDEWSWITNASENSKKDDIDFMLEHSDLLSRKLMKLTNLYEHRMNDFFAKDIKEESPAAQAAPKQD